MAIPWKVCTLRREELLGPQHTFVFDLDGTLVDTAADLCHAANHILESEGLQAIPFADMRNLVGHGARHLISCAYRKQSRAVTEQYLDILVDRFVTFYADHIAVESRPFAGVVACLEVLKAAGVCLAVCTNKREKLSRALLTALDLAPYFKAIVGPDTYNVAKPEGAHLAHAIKQAGGRERDAIMIGDSAPDVGAALALKIPVIVVDFGYSQTPVQDLGANAVISHFREVIPTAHSLMKPT